MRSATRVGAYYLSLQRQHGASAKSTVAMMASDRAQGELKDNTVVLTHEIFAGVAQKLKAKMLFEDTVAQATKDDGAHVSQTILLNCDATHDRICAWDKMHVAFVEANEIDDCMQFSFSSKSGTTKAAS